MRKNGHRARLSLKESIFAKMLRYVSEQHAARNPDFTVKSRRSASTVSDLQQRHVPVLPIPEGFKPKGAMDSARFISALAEASASAANYALPSHLLA
ncbi:hypothetical protein [Undibacterium danionis]|uniref:Uncharacterized protein n=1 Tax=Undibacterium danionis TaxID=1812100 RepID=A0ABV6IFC2_9BURK